MVDLLAMTYRWYDVSYQPETPGGKGVNSELPFLTLRRACRVLTSYSLVWVALATTSLAQQQTITLDVDATTIARKILHAHESFPVASSSAHTVDLVYPKWIPGNHAP